MLKISDNLLQKKALIESPQKSAQMLRHKVYLSIHDVQLCFHLNSEELICELYDIYPLSWFDKKNVESIDIFWTNSRSMDWSDEEWEDEINPECIVINQDHGKIAIQRDFVAQWVGPRCDLICPYELSDGFYNFLRWLLPLKLIQQGKMLIHSSCVLDDQGGAYFSLGASGAGKSTIASYRPRKKILGDDMNILKIEEGACWAQAGALGQAILNPTEYSRWHPVRALFWLKKSESVEMRSMSRATQLLCLNSSVANVFWDQLSEKNVREIFQQTVSVLKHVSIYELSFPKQEKVWDEIFSMIQKQASSQRVH